VGLQDFSPAPWPLRCGPDIETAPGVRRKDWSAQRGGAGQPERGDAPRARLVPVGQRRGQPCI
jgi:hypothetical protein